MRDAEVAFRRLVYYYVPAASYIRATSFDILELEVCLAVHYLLNALPGDRVLDRLCSFRSS